MAKTDFPSIDAYIFAQPDQVQPALHEVRAILRAAWPDAEEGISYQIPVLRLGGKLGLYFAGYARHYAIYPATKGIVEGVGEDLAPYLVSKATLKFSLPAPVPAALIRHIADARLAELLAAGG